MRIFVLSYLGNNKARWGCERGHEWTGLLFPRRDSFGRKIPGNHFTSEAACKLHASWWSKDKGGCSGKCPECERGTPLPCPACCGSGRAGELHCARCGGMGKVSA